MRSLSARIALAFALISLVGIGVAALFVRQLVATRFDDFVLEQRRAELVELAASSYSANGGWERVSPALRARAQPRGGGPRRGEPDPPGAFTLVDQQGRIVLSANPQERGALAETRRLGGGTPVSVDGAVVGTIYLSGAPPRNPAEEAYLASTDRALGAAALVAAAVAAGLGLLLARVITRPLRDLTQATRRIAGGQLGQQVPVRSRDELGLLARQFNAMSADLQRATELRRRLTADIAHDLRTPLTVIAGYLEALRDESLRPTAARFAAMHAETQVLLRLVEDLHTLSLADAGELPLRRQPSDPSALLERAARTYADAAAQAGVALLVEPAPGLPPLSADPEQLLRALGNLLSNALRYTPAGGRVTLRARLEGAPRAIVFEVADTGRGIAAEHLPNVFERFYRADESRHQAGGGSGLGLAIVRSIVAAHGGQVAVRSAPGDGSTFSMALPL